MGAEPRLLSLGVIEAAVWLSARYLETRFPDGLTVSASPEDTDDYRATAVRLGYGVDTWRMCREHEIAHTWLMRKLGYIWSPTLHLVAKGFADNNKNNPLVKSEEAMVLQFQSYVNNEGDHPQELPQILIEGFQPDWAALSEEFAVLIAGEI